MITLIASVDIEGTPYAPFNREAVVNWCKGKNVLQGRKTLDKYGLVTDAMNLVLSKTIERDDIIVLRSPLEVQTIATECDIFVLGGVETFHSLLPFCRSLILDRWYMKPMSANKALISYFDWYIEEINHFGEFSTLVMSKR